MKIKDVAEALRKIGRHAYYMMAIFRIKANDAVVEKSIGEFVTVLKDGVNHNTSVKRAINERK